MVSHVEYIIMSSGGSESIWKIIIVIIIVLAAMYIGLTFVGIDPFKLLEDIFSIGHNTADNVSNILDAAQPTNSRIQHSDSIFF